MHVFTEFFFFFFFFFFFVFRPHVRSLYRERSHVWQPLHRVDSCMSSQDFFFFFFFFFFLFFFFFVNFRPRVRSLYIERSHVRQPLQADSMLEIFTMFVCLPMHYTYICLFFFYAKVNMLWSNPTFAFILTRTITSAINIKCLYDNVAQHPSK